MLTLTPKLLGRKLSHMRGEQRGVTVNRFVSHEHIAHSASMSETTASIIASTKAQTPNCTTQSQKNWAYQSAAGPLAKHRPASKNDGSHCA